MPTPSQLWPYLAESTQVAEGINWASMDPLVVLSPPHMWRKISKADADKLINDARSLILFPRLPEKIQEAVRAAAELAPLPKAESIEKPPGDAKQAAKERMLKRIEDTIEAAEVSGDMAAQLRGLDMIGKLEKLIGKEADQEKTIIINVITGVDRI